jgi:DNA-binding CsgD family transcriptional regulator
MWFPLQQKNAWSLKRKLFGYMLLLAAGLIVVILCGLLLLGRFDSAEKEAYESLSLQLDVFEKDVFEHFDDLAAAGIRLSEDTTELLETCFAEKNITFADLQDSEVLLREVQQRMLEPLQNVLLREDCSGAFVLLDTTVNSALADADRSKAGLYLQINGYGSADHSVLLYRGQAQVGKDSGIMPHRKWRQEFHADLLPGYDAMMAQASLPLEKSYRFTDLFTLPGTSEKAILAVVPIVGTDGTVYGLCGFEVSESYFTAYHAQMTDIRHMTGLMTPASAEAIDTSAGLSCGVAQGYYRAPQGNLTTRDAGKGLLYFEGDAVRYIGLQRALRLSPNNEDYTLSVMMLASDYSRAVNQQNLKNLILSALVIFFAVNGCVLFTRRFLQPIIKGLEQIKANEQGQAQSRVMEINDLFAYLAEKDRSHEEELLLLEEEKLQAEKEKQQIEEEKIRIQSEYEKAQKKYEAAYAKIHRIESEAKPEINTEEYQAFVSGIQNLTPMESRIFNYYLQGMTVSQIMEVSSIKESTLRYHNRNIYNKLGVSSLKQLLRYAAQMQNQIE